MIQNSMPKHFSLNQWLVESNSVWLLVVGMLFFLVGCRQGDAFEESPTQQIALHTTSSSPTAVATRTAVITPTLNLPTPTPSTMPPTLAPTQMPTPTTSPSPTPFPTPQLLIAVIEVKQRGEADERHDIWLVNTVTEDKRLVFTASPGTGVTKMMWGGEGSDTLYITEMQGLDEGFPIWQLYEVNYETGQSRAFFAEPMEGTPTLLDLSAQGKWLRLRVDYWDHISFDWWFIHTEDGTVVKNSLGDPYLYGFVWSPNEPDLFAYSQKSTLDADNRQIPQGIVISQLPDFTVLDIINYRYTGWGGDPLLLWDLSEPEHILFLARGEIHIVDLTENQWNRIAQGLDIFPGDGITKLLKSPSGQWAVTTTYIRVIQLNDTIQIVARFEDKVGRGHKFLSWYGDEDWMVIATRSNLVQIYELGGDFNLLWSINFGAYGIRLREPSAILARPLEQCDCHE